MLLTWDFFLFPGYESFIGYTLCKDFSPSLRPFYSLNNAFWRVGVFFFSFPHEIQLISYRLCIISKKVFCLPKVTDIFSNCFFWKFCGLGFYTGSIIHLVFIFIDPRYELTLSFFWHLDVQLFQYHLLKKAIHFLHHLFICLSGCVGSSCSVQDLRCTTGDLHCDWRAQEVHRVGLVAPGHVGS